MKQPRALSLAESAANVVVGYVLAIGVQVAAFPLFGISVTIGQNLALGLLFAVVSTARSYALRRVFEHMRKI